MVKALLQLIETTWASRPSDRPRFEDIVPALASIERKLNRSQRLKKTGRASTQRVAFQPMAFTRSGSAPHLRRESFGRGEEEPAERSKMPSTLLSSTPPESLLQSARWTRNNSRGGHEDPVCWNLPPDFFGERARSMTSSSFSLSVRMPTSTGSISSSGSSHSACELSQDASSQRSIEQSAEWDSAGSKSTVTKVRRATCCHAQAVGTFIARAWVSMWTKFGLMFPDESYETTFLKHHYFTPRYFRALLGVGICACLLYIGLVAMLMYSTSPTGLIVCVPGAVRCIVGWGVHRVQGMFSAPCMESSLENGGLDCGHVTCMNVMDVQVSVAPISAQWGRSKRFLCCLWGCAGSQRCCWGLDICPFCFCDGVVPLQYNARPVGVDCRARDILSGTPFFLCFLVRRAGVLVCPLLWRAGSAISWTRLTDCSGCKCGELTTQDLSRFCAFMSRFQRLFVSGSALRACKIYTAWCNKCWRCHFKLPRLIFFLLRMQHTKREFCRTHTRCTTKRIRRACVSATSLQQQLRT